MCKNKVLLFLLLLPLIFSVFSVNSVVDYPTNSRCSTHLIDHSPSM
jgi:hypothetical protein